MLLTFTIENYDFDVLSIENSTVKITQIRNKPQRGNKKFVKSN